MVKRQKITGNTGQLFMEDSIKKELQIQIEGGDMQELNFYGGTIGAGGYGQNKTKAAGTHETTTLIYTEKTPAWSTSGDVFNFEYKNKAAKMRLGFFLNRSTDQVPDDAYIQMGISYNSGGKSYTTRGTRQRIKDMPLNINMPFYIEYNDMAAFEKLNNVQVTLGSDSTTDAFTVMVGISRFYLYMTSGDFETAIEEHNFIPGYNIKGINLEEYMGQKEEILAAITNNDLELEAFQLTESLCSADRVKFGLCEAARCEFTFYDRPEDFSDRYIRPYIKAEGSDERLALGRFKVESIRKQHMHNLIKKSIVAYDDIAGLDTNAFNWYTFYMYAINSDGYPVRRGYEYARQIYSAYFNIAQELGLEKRSNYAETVIEDGATHYVSFTRSKNTEGSKKVSVDYAGGEIEGIQPGGIYVVDIETACTKQELLAKIPYYKEYIDKNGRGLLNCNIMIIEETPRGDIKFAVDAGDYFMLSPDATAAYYYYPSFMKDDSTKAGFAWINKTRVSKVQKSIDLTNGSTRLMYYNWWDGEIFEADSTITARDVIRSLIEVTGAFFKMDRNGSPAFIYAEKSGLYPSNTLLPSDDLHPRKAEFISENMGQYMSFISEDYTVEKYGRIQIIKREEGNEAKALVQWEYKGPGGGRNTYLIDDNIFYSNSALEYEFDSMPEVSLLLENMYNRISNMNFTPHQTVAKGLPYLETGDRIALLTKTGGIESFIFRRTLHGIHHLVDTYEAEGPRWNRPVAEYAYTERS